MKINTLYLPGFSHHLCGRRAKATASKIMDRADKLDGLATLLSRFVSPRLFDGVDKRQRTYTGWVTFCAFFGQVLHRGASCRDAVRRVQAWYLAIAPSKRVDEATGGYCQARARLPVEVLQEVFAKLARWCAHRTRSEELWRGRVVKLIDGCGVSMPDTAENRELYPYAGGQKPGCGFPTGQLVGLFSLCSGHLVRFVSSSWKAHEAPLASELVDWVQPGEVILADRGFCSWGLISLFQARGVDTVMRLHQRRAVRMGSQVWSKPLQPKHWDKDQWHSLPQDLAMRVIKLSVKVPGFRTQAIILATTLMDQEAYPDQALAELYLRRWQVETDFRDLKITLGLDVLRTTTPAMIEKEIYLQAIAYNLTRALMLEAARQHDVPSHRLSFKGTLSAVRAMTPIMALGPKRTRDYYDELLAILAADTLPYRPDRAEPRAVKRRPKNYQYLNQPRAEMSVSDSRRQK